MNKETAPITIKKYANRRLYNTGTSTYVTLEDLAVMVKNGEEFIVLDAKSGEEITRSVLTQIIFEQEGKGGTNLLPITFLRQLIRFYGDSMQALVPSYLDMSIASLTKEQGRLRSQMGTAFGSTPFAAMEEQVRTNMAMFENAFRVFSPFPGGTAGAAGTEAPAETGTDIDDLKKEIAAMKDKIDKLGSPRS
jgi:polyhydroxyalkanoate synthesis repressor PhaR